MLFSVLTNVKGCSGKVFNISSNNLAGRAIKLLLSDSTIIEVEKVVSRSDAVKVNLFPLILNRKLSKIGRVLVLLITPPNI